jgi:hypothetical protein
MVEYGHWFIWSRDGAAFIDDRNSYARHWLFDGGIDVPASWSTCVVPVPLSVEAVDAEEAFVASYVVEMERC